jgi:ketosteroid isomerase-like protein
MVRIVRMDWFSGGALLLALGCAGSPPDQAPAEPEADAQVLMEMEREFARSVAEKDLTEFLEFWAEDGAALPHGAPLAEGREEVRKVWEGLFADHDATLTWIPTRAAIARSGDLGFTYGSYTSSRRGPDGRERVQKGKYVTIWRKDPGGTWRVLVDGGNPDTPPGVE